LITICSLTIFHALQINKNFTARTVAAIILIGCIHFIARADDETTTTNSWTPQNSRFGLFNCLDHRSGYYQDSFPQPLLVDDTSLEETELELNYSHTAAGQQRSSIASAGGQKSFGVVTFELEVPYERFSDSDDTVKGIGNIELNVRSPIYQYVSASGWFDTTMGVAMETGIPVNSKVSKYTELEPAVFDDLKLGRHFTVQTVLGYDTLVGGGGDGGSAEFDYGLAFAWTIPRAELPIPGVERISPMFEVNGEYGLNEDEAGENSVLGNIGFRLDFRNIGELQPSLALGYVFPMTSDARAAVHWGIAANFTLEF
jgi:hypothetical protein